MSNEIEAPEGEKKDELTGWTQRIEVMFLGKGETQADAVGDATATMTSFIDELRHNPKVRLVSAPEARFGTRKVGPQP